MSRQQKLSSAVELDANPYWQHSQLSNLPLEAQQSMRGDLMGTAHGRILLKLESNADPLEWAQQCVKERMDAEELARAVQRRLAEYN